MPDPIIEVKNLRVIYNQGKSNEVRSLEDVTVKIYPHEYVIIYGPSGCGKSTLLYAISGLQAPTYGEVTVEGRNLAQIKKREMVELHQVGIGMIFQAFYLISSLSVIDNICLPKIFRGEQRKERMEASFQLLRRFGIVEQAQKFPSQLSGGQKQRVAIARALVNNPQIILADEPVGNLDSESAQNVLDILKELNEVDKKTIIMVTHNPEHLQYADRVIHMKDGKVIKEDVIKEKRPKGAIKGEEDQISSTVSNELRILMRTFKNLSPQQIGVLLIPFKVKQIMSHILSELTDEQVSTGENFLKELLFRNFTIEQFQKSLDTDFEKGGANWNKKRSETFAKRVKEIMEQTEMLKSSPIDSGVSSFGDYLMRVFDVKLDQESLLRFHAFLKLRFENRIDHFGLRQRLDASRILGGVGFHKYTAEKIAREVELILLLKYSA